MVIYTGLRLLGPPILLMIAFIGSKKRVREFFGKPALYNINRAMAVLPHDLPVADAVIVRQPTQDGALWHLKNRGARRLHNHRCEVSPGLAQRGVRTIIP